MYHVITLTLQIKFCPEPEKFILDDGYQPPATLTSPSREILGATFYKYVLKNIGMLCSIINIWSKDRWYRYLLNILTFKLLFYRATCTCSLILRPSLRLCVTLKSWEGLGTRLATFRCDFNIIFVGHNQNCVLSIPLLACTYNNNSPSTCIW